MIHPPRPIHHRRLGSAVPTLLTPSTPRERAGALVEIQEMGRAGIDLAETEEFAPLRALVLDGHTLPAPEIVRALLAAPRLDGPLLDHLLALLSAQPTEGWSPGLVTEMVARSVTLASTPELLGRALDALDRTPFLRDRAVHRTLSRRIAALGTAPLAWRLWEQHRHRTADPEVYLPLAPLDPALWAAIVDHLHGEHPGRGLVAPTQPLLAHAPVGGERHLTRTTVVEQVSAIGLAWLPPLLASPSAPVARAALDRLVDGFLAEPAIVAQTLAEALDHLRRRRTPLEVDAPRLARLLAVADRSLRSDIARLIGARHLRRATGATVAATPSP